MVDIETLEVQRQEAQERFESQRKAKERNRHGQFATPLSLAFDIIKYVWQLWKERTEPVRFLDPALGTGVFYSAFRQMFAHDTVSEAKGIELDPILADVASSLWGQSGLTVTQGDFTKQPFPSADQRFNLLVGNPPYVRHHHLERGEKERLQALISQVLRMRVSGLAGLYCYFLLLCDRWLEEDGIAVWLIPSEFMDVNYGTVVK